MAKKNATPTSDSIVNKRVAHPVWDLTHSDAGPAIVRKVQEDAERSKNSDLGWLGKSVATYIGGAKVMARVASINDDNTFNLVTSTGNTIECIDEAFITFIK